MIRGISRRAGVGLLKMHGRNRDDDGRNTVNDGFRTATRNQTPPQTARKTTQGNYSPGAHAQEKETLVAPIENRTEAREESRWPTKRFSTMSPTKSRRSR